MFKDYYKRASAKDVVGTSLKGEITSDYWKLEELFGAPLRRGGDKTQVEWHLKFKDGTIANIYDWKKDIDPTKNKEWNIGGSSRKAFLYVSAIVLGHYRPLIKEVFEGGRR